jgi:hypothetical protein
MERARILGGTLTINSRLTEAPQLNSTFAYGVQIMKPEISIAIADDHPIFRQGLRQ